MTWDLFTEKMPQVPASSVDQAGPLPGFAGTRLQHPALGKFPPVSRVPTLAELEAPPSALQRASGWARWAGLA